MVAGNSKKDNMTFNDLQFKANPFIEGIQAVVHFPSGYSVSVIQGPHTYGGSQGLYELAVLFNGNMNYDNPVANGNVRGYLTPDEVTSLIQQVEQFRACKQAFQIP